MSIVPFLFDYKKKIKYRKKRKYGKVITMKTIGLYYYKYPNIGDILNEIFIKDLFGIETVEENYCTADMMAIGSIFDRLFSDWKVYGEEAKLRENPDVTNPIHVWGSGIIKHYDKPSELIRPVKIHALRGDLTRQLISKSLGKEVKCVLADPGLLAGLLIKQQEKKYKLGIIPHYVDAQDLYFENIKKSCAGSIIIDVKAEPFEVLKMIAQCEVIVSTSLHGLIIADSLGIPNLWCESSDRIIGEGFKYRDYYSAFGIAEIKPFDLRSGRIPDIEDIKKNYKIEFKDVKKKQKELLKSFPYKNINVLRTYFKIK